MPIGSMTLMNASQSALLALGGEMEPSHSRRRIDLLDCFYVRCQYEGSGGTASIRVDYSLDDGTTWAELVPAGPSIASAAMIVTPWNLVPDDALRGGDILIRPVATAAAGLTLTMYYVEFQYR